MLEVSLGWAGRPGVVVLGRGGYRWGLGCLLGSSGQVRRSNPRSLGRSGRVGGSAGSDSGVVAVMGRWEVVAKVR